MHSRVFLSPIFIIPIKKTEIILIAIYQDFLFNQILKNGLVEKIDGFFKTPKKISKKKLY